ncbi:MAG: T9SS type A sorting domain-containing protein [Calditrichaeota bacterium]|nr:T9SS type A sorting domain-containing protein [Calditrichota bacterium]
MKIFSAKLFVSALIALTIPMFSTQTSQLFCQDRSEVRQVGQLFDQFGESHDIEVDGRTVFMASGISGLQIFDVSDPANPELSGSYENNPDFTSGVSVRNPFVFIADRRGGLRIINYSDRENLVEVGFLDTPGDALGVDVLNDLVVIADGREGGVRIIDVSDPENPREIANIDTPGDACAAMIFRNLVYIADGRSGLLVYEIDPPGEPRLAISFDTPGYLYDVVAQGRWIYLADGTGGVIIVDISNGRAEVRSSFDTDNCAKKIDVWFDSVYVADDEGGLLILDFTDMDRPILRGSLELPGRSMGIGVLNDHANLANNRDGLRIVDIHHPHNPEEVGSVSTPGWWARNSSIDGQFCYLANSDGGLRIIDISDPANPDSVGSWDSPGTACDVAVEDNIAYIADGPEGIRVVDVSDPENPDEVANVVSSNALCVEKVGDYLFVADGRDGGLRVVNVSDPDRPVVARVLITEGDGYWLDVEGDLLYMADGDNGLVVINIENPERPSVVATLNDIGRVMGVDIAGDFAYLVDMHTGLRVVDISDPREPRQMGIIETPGTGRGVSVSGDYAYVGSGTGGLRVIDISNPEELEEVGFFDTPGYAYTPTLHDGLIYLSDGSGFGIYDFTGDLGFRDLNMSLDPGWNMISLNISPPRQFWRGDDGPAVIPLLERLRANENRHHVVLLKDEIGRFYSPEFNFNNIPFWNLTEGYFLYIEEDVETVFTGEAIPYNADIPLTEGWNIAAYFPTYELDAGDPVFFVLRNILDNLILAKDRDGRFMNPEWRFSNMQPWRETQGYQINVDADVVLNYPQQDEGRIVGDMESELKNRNSHWYTPQVTDNNMSLLISSITGMELSLNDEVAAFDWDGMVVGVGIFDRSGRAGITIWGDDSATEYKEGPIAGEPFELKLWDASRQWVRDISIVDIESGSGLIYEPEGFAAVTAEVYPIFTGDFHLEGAFPNPFNPTTKIKYTVPIINSVSLQVFDIKGRLVETLVEGVMPPGTHSVVWDAGGVGAGVYIVRMKGESGNMGRMRKVVLVK